MDVRVKLLLARLIARSHAGRGWGCYVDKTKPACRDCVGIGTGRHQTDRQIISGTGVHGLDRLGGLERLLSHHSC